MAKLAEVDCHIFCAPGASKDICTLSPSQNHDPTTPSHPTTMEASITATGLRRAGGPKLCDIPYNSRTTVIEQLPFQELQPILETWKVCGSMQSMECTPCYDDSAEPILTLQVMVDTPRDDSRENWLQAAQEMHDLLRRHGLGHVTVDIIDWRLKVGPNILICEPTDAIFSKWDMVRKRILESVDVSGFQMLGCYRMGYKDVEYKPTILITVDPKSERNWNLAKQDVNNILNEFDLSMVDVEIYKDRSIFCARRPSIQSEINSRYLVHTREGPRVATIGHSVGPDSEWEPFGLTCRHCIFDKHRQDALISESAQEVDCPTYGKVKECIDKLTETVSYLKRGEPYRTLEQLRVDGDLPDDRKALWRNLRDLIKSHEDGLTHLHSYYDLKTYRFGEVWAHSGDGTTRIMDWALLKPHPTRACPSNKFGQFTERYLPMFLKAENGYIEQGLPLDHGQPLHTYGCESNAAICRYSILPTTIFTVAANGERRATDEQSVCRRASQPSFEPGDSGALLFTGYGNAVGMAFGGQVQGQIVVFTHIDDLIADIKEQTAVDEVVFYTQEWPGEPSRGPGERDSGY
ncbi:hypothetical protein AO1008_06599 [Aspergillus oryzae 100-8]|nr:hypothetical protein Ao3042_07198 [Aspergillus oryzae 3.042]KDE80501.1 hypothetical protein AO1008_06599 [Aspergillus oryzae 100-8]|eukprot:EIT76821.1 hypothetical protein Ao3042_07198 [Aspergillus oryzae 3.042]